MAAVLNYPPNVSQADIAAFHAAHFSLTALQHFSADFIENSTAANDDTYDANDEYFEGEEEDDLGYYSDGVKRTLTDEQIAIFRHSELETLRREKANGTKNSNSQSGQGENRPADTDSTKQDNGQQVSGSEDGELESDTPQPISAAAKRKKARKNRKKARNSAHNSQQHEPGWFKKNVKPDLRKRTWDKVETGMDSLDYEDAPQAESGNGTGPPTQRRKISYDD
ncbi:hypothetical protein PG993_014578 [Apiospora rasikravindrae]|uniref:Uncharacterized protein n=1 Tax=Apiospora rasikravindrae TaxID=990691 RepID=A0ABR1RN48_9PEZI